MKNFLAICLIYPIFAISQENQNLQKDTIVSICACTDANLKETTFSPDLASLMTYKDFKKSGFDFKNGKEGFERLFIKNVDPSNLTIWTKRIVNLVYKKNIFILNLTPCKTERKYSEIYTQSKVFGDDRNEAFDVTIQLPNIQIELSEKIIRRWNTTTKKPIINNGLYLNSPILVKSPKNKDVRLSLSGERGFSRFENTEICMNDTEISNTNVEIKLLSRVFLFDLSYKGDSNKSYLNSGIKNYLEKLKVSNVDVNNLSGVYSDDSKISIPLENYNIESNENNTLIINNNLIIGKMQIKCHRTENNEEILLLVNGKENKYNINKLSEKVLKLGFEKTKIEIDGNNLVIYFIKFSERK